MKPSTSASGNYFATYFAQGCLIPYFPLWLASYGLTIPEIGFIVSMAYLPKLISNPLSAHIADKTGRIQLLLVCVLVYVASCYIVLSNQKDSSYFLLLTLAAQLGLSAVFPLSDRLALLASQNEQHGKGYGAIRQWGSLGFAAGTIGCSIIVHHTNVSPILYLVVVSFIGAIIFCLSTERNMTTPNSGTIKLPMLTILRSPITLIVILAGAFVQASNAHMYSFSSVGWTSQGLSITDVGFLWIVGIGAEILMFRWSKTVLNRVGLAGILFIGSIGTILRWIILGSTEHYILLLLAQLLQCCTISANNIGVMTFISRCVPPEARTSAISLYILLAMGIFISGLTHLDAYLSSTYSVNGFYLMAAVSALSVPLFITTYLLNSFITRSVKHGF